MALIKSITRADKDSQSSKSSLTILALLAFLVMGAMAILAFDLEKLFGINFLGVNSSSNIFPILVFVSGMACLVLLLIFANKWGSKVTLQLSAVDEQNRRNQQAILLLLDEMTNLAEGDLTVHTTVTEDITGAIADSVNYSIDALRNLVYTINNTSKQVASA
ncbi:MAG: chemotaxis protein, partial [Gammaproteobacteria bacterium]